MCQLAEGNLDKPQFDQLVCVAMRYSAPKGAGTDTLKRLALGLGKFANGLGYRSYQS